MNFKEMLLNEVVRPELRAQPHTTIGTVLAYSKEHNLCAVEIRASALHGSTNQVLLEVPVVITNGFNDCGPFPGQRVVVEFLDGQPNNAIIVGVLNRVYNTSVRETYHRHDLQGAYIADSISSREFRWLDSGPGWGDR